MRSKQRPWPWMLKEFMPWRKVWVPPLSPSPAQPELQSKIFKIHLCVLTHVRTYTYADVHMCVCTHVRTYTCAYIHVSVHVMCTLAYMCICLNVLEILCVYMYMQEHTLAAMVTSIFN